MIIFKTPQGQFTLRRYPIRDMELLRAWDAADEYLLSQLQNEPILLKTACRILILNDFCGALSLPLAERHPDVVSDSFLAVQAIRQNLLANGIPPEQVHLQDSLQELASSYDLIIIKIPKTLSMLEYQLYQIRNSCHSTTRIIAAAMSKNIHTSTLKLFEKIIGPTKTSLAQKKSRLVFSTYDASLTPGQSPYPSQYSVDTTDDLLTNHANVFSREKLDIGSRFFMQHMPQNSIYEHIVDLACGNGLLGVTAARLNPQAHISFLDESFMAVESARINYQNLIGKPSNVTFTVTDCLMGIADNSVDLILNNPPFHQQHAVGDFIALQMFKEAKNKLRPGGELWVIGNRHLAYHSKLKNLYGNCTLVASNKKFVILKVTRQ